MTRRIHDPWPPPSVVGASRWPYPGTDGQSYGMAEACKAVRARRAQSGLIALPPAETLLVRPDWLDTPIFTRTGEQGWQLHRPGVARVADAAVRIGLKDRLPRPQRWYDDDPLERVLSEALTDYLHAATWWMPDAAPKASPTLVSLFDQLLRDGRWTWDDAFPKEHDAAEQQPGARSHPDDYMPWESRSGRLQIEEMIVTSGRTAPFRLRPLVLITQNAGMRQWWYGGWGVYDADAEGHAGALLAVYGKHARFNSSGWMAPSRYDGPMPSPDDVSWYGYQFDDGYGSHADVLCALTGVSLQAAQRGRIVDATRPADAFVPAIPRVLSTLGSDGDVLERVRGFARDDHPVRVDSNDQGTER